MEKLSDLAIQRIIDDYPDEILRQFKTQIECKLRDRNQYRIVIGINAELYTSGITWLSHFYITAMKFLLRTVDIFFNDFTALKNTQRYSLAEHVKQGSKLIEDLDKMTSYKEYLEYFLSHADIYSDYEIKMIYIQIIFPNLRYGFNKEESLKICEYYNEFEKEHPDYDQRDILNSIIVNEGDYVFFESNQI